MKWSAIKKWTKAWRAPQEKNFTRWQRIEIILLLASKRHEKQIVKKFIHEFGLFFRSIHQIKFISFHSINFIFFIRSVNSFPLASRLMNFIPLQVFVPFNSINGCCGNRIYKFTEFILEIQWNDGMEWNWMNEINGVG